MALGVSGVFWVRYFRGFLHVSESNVLFIACATTAVTAVGLFMVGRLIDRAGNKPALTASGLLFVCHFSGWGLVAAGILPFDTPVLCFQIFTSGLAGALWNLANVRIVMGIVPHMGRPHFPGALQRGEQFDGRLVPLLWGPVMDYLNHWNVAWGIWQWNCYSLFYVTLALTVCLGLFMLRSVVEPITMTWDVFMRELLVNTPSRAVSRLINRLRGPSIG